MAEHAEDQESPVVASKSPADGPAQDAAPATDAPAAPRSSGFFLGAAGAAVAGALLTMAVLGGRQTPTETASAAPPLVRTTPAARHEPPALLTRWTQAHQDRWISNHRQSVAYEIDASRPVPVWMRHVRPTLVVRCLAKKTDVFVYTDSAAQIERRDDNHTVRIAFDDGPVTVERWPDSADHDALFAPDGAAFARRLASARSLRFGFTPHNADSVVADFPVEGFEAIAAGMARTCGWR